MPLVKFLIFAFDKLLAEVDPALSTALSELQLPPDFYALKWFITLFTYSLPIASVCRVWDYIIGGLYTFARIDSRNLCPRLPRPLP